MNLPLARLLLVCMLAISMALVSANSKAVKSVSGAPTEDEGTFTVTESSDMVDIDPSDGRCDSNAVLEGDQCTLRAAIMESNVQPDKNLILLPAGVITLMIPGNQEENAIRGDLDIRGPLEIRGAGVDQSIIDGGALDRIFDIQFMGLPAYSVELSGLTLRNGQADAGLPFDGNASCEIVPDCGGTIRVAANLIVTDVVTSLSGAFRGGGIAVLANGSLVMTGGRVAENYGAQGGGIFSEGEVTLNNVTLSSNQSKLGGGITLAAFGSAYIENGTIQYNHADNGGGMAVLGSEASIILEQGAIGGNQATANGGGAYVSGQATFTQTYFDYNRAGQTGGGIYGVTAVSGESSGIVTANDSLFAFNEAEQGGAITLDGLSMVLSGSTLNKNIATTRPCGALAITATLPSAALVQIFNSTLVANSGGICHSGMATELTHVTIANNLTTGIELNGADITNFIVRNSVVANNAEADCRTTAAQNSLPWLRTHIQNAGNCTFSGEGITINGDALLGALEDNGGNTPTLVPLPGSPLIDRIEENALCETFDQRGISRPSDGDGDGSAACDLGATEREAAQVAPSQLFLPLILKPRASSWQQLGDNGQRLSTVAFDILPNQGVRVFVGDTRLLNDGGGLYSAPLPSDCRGMSAFQKLPGDFRVLDLLFNGELALGATFGNSTIFWDRANDIWLETPSKINPNVYALVQGEDGAIYAGSDDGVYKSTSSTEWVKFGGPPNINTLELRGNLLWIGTADNGIQLLNVTTNQMIAQDNIGLQRSALNVWDILIEGDRFYVATSDGVYRRTGDNVYAADGLSGQVVNTLESNGQTIFAGVRNNGAWIRDEVSGWAALQSGTGWNATGTVRKLRYNKDLCGGGLFAATDNGLWVLEAP